MNPWDKLKIEDIWLEEEQRADTFVDVETSWENVTFLYTMGS